MKINKKLMGAVSFLGATYIVLDVIAKKQKPDTTFENEPDQKNPLEGRKVVLIEDEKDEENADGVRGHLEAIGIEPETNSFYDKVVKRAIDKSLAFCGLIALSPVYLTIAIAIKVEDPGPVFFTQKRVGKNKKYFKLHKFRSMKMETPHDVPTHMLEKPEQYITKVGGFLRAHSLDELPQIWDIFVGNMSVIGPRPALWNQDKLTSLRDEYNANNIKPGLTGWAQINGRDELRLEDKAKLDGEYVKNEGLLMDVKCFLGSIHVFGRDDSIVEGGTVEMEKDATAGDLYDSDTVPSGKKKILITGADSYIGNAVRDYLVSVNPQMYYVDILDTKGLRPTEDNFVGYDVVFNVAGIAHIKETRDNRNLYYDVNRDLVIEIAEAAKKAGVKQFIMLSSMSVYGLTEGHITKKTKPAPVNAYGDSKLQADEVILKLAEDWFKIAILRPPMVYGRGCKGNYQSLRSFSLKSPIFPEYRNARSMIYIDNLCEFVKRIIDSEECGLFFPQNSEYVNTSEMVRLISSVNNHHIIETRVFNPIIKIASIDILKKVFGNLTYDHVDTVSKYRFEDSIRLTETRNKIMGYEIENETIEDLRGKRILFFAPAFFGYEDKMAEKMREMGALVDFYDERSVVSSRDRALLKISPSIFAKRSYDYYKDIIDANKEKDYDFIFVIKGEMTPVHILKDMRSYFPNAKLCLYLYDSVANIPGIAKKFQYFDTCHSFDPDDCEKYKELKFKPLFFADQFRKQLKSTNDYVYDICFMGTIHSDRYKIIKEIQQISQVKGLRQKWFLYLQSKSIYRFYKLTKKEFRNTKSDDFDFDKKNSEEIADVIDKSKIVLDIQHPKQIGLTMRTIEMLGMNKKLITTNSTIKNYDFYNPNNICVIDRNDIKIDMNFLDTPYQAIKKDVYESYSLENWIKSVLV